MAAVIITGAAVITAAEDITTTTASLGRRLLGRILVSLVFHGRLGYPFLYEYLTLLPLCVPKCCGSLCVSKCGAYRMQHR